MVGRAGGGTAVGVGAGREVDRREDLQRCGLGDGRRHPRGLPVAARSRRQPRHRGRSPRRQQLVDGLGRRAATSSSSSTYRRFAPPNIIPVFAAGNYGPLASTSRSPANNPEALAVGATTKTDGDLDVSSQGPTRLRGHRYDLSRGRRARRQHPHDRPLQRVRHGIGNLARRSARDGSARAPARRKCGGHGQSAGERARDHRGRSRPRRPGHAPSATDG